MNPESATGLWEFLRKLYPEFLGGAIAYWTHHAFHRIWHATGNLPRLMTRVLRRGGNA